MTDERLEEIRKREQRATRGPWFAVDGEGGGEDVATILACCDTVYGPPLADFSAQWIQDDWLEGTERSLNWTEAVAADVTFCAHARTDIPELLAEVDRLRAENVRLREDTARRCAEIARSNYEYVTPETDYWAGVKHGYRAVETRIIREFGLEAKSE